MSVEDVPIGSAKATMTIRFEPSSGGGYWDITTTDDIVERMVRAVKASIDILGGRVVEVHPDPMRNPER